MRTRWVVFALGIAAVAHAGPDPMPVEVKPASAPAPAEPGPKPTAAKIQKAAKAPAIEAAPLAGITDDAVLGQAARVNGNEVHGVVAFTFDDGPNPQTTPTVIDALEKYDIPATFFIVTRNLRGEKGRAVLARELADGFLVGDHSMTHPNLKHAAGKQLDKEIDDSIKLLAKDAGRPIGLFRPPYGALSGAGRVRLKRLGVTEVIWSIDTLDWQAHNAERLRRKVLKMILADNGGIVLMHDVHEITAKVIPEVLDDLEAENCKRLADGKDPIVPVSIHYFLRDGKTSRPIPADVQKRTDAYKAALPGRCAKRPAPPAPPAAT